MGWGRMAREAGEVVGWWVAETDELAGAGCPLCLSFCLPALPALSACPSVHLPPSSSPPTVARSSPAAEAAVAAHLVGDGALALAEARANVREKVIGLILATHLSKTFHLCPKQLHTQARSPGPICKIQSQAGIRSPGLRDFRVPHAA
jgi:hypothetical protein